MGRERSMRREPPITLRGAAQLLGHYERPWVDRLDRLLGGVILAAGVGLVFPPLATLTPIFGLEDQKSEAVGLLNQGLDWLQSRVSKVQGYERVELMAARRLVVCCRSGNRRLATGVESVERR